MSTSSPLQGQVSQLGQSRNTARLRGDGFQEKGRKAQLQGVSIKQLRLFPKWPFSMPLDKILHLNAYKSDYSKDLTIHGQPKQKLIKTVFYSSKGSLSWCKKIKEHWTVIVAHITLISCNACYCSFLCGRFVVVIFLYRRQMEINLHNLFWEGKIHLSKKYSALIHRHCLFRDITFKWLCINKDSICFFSRKVSKIEKTLCITEEFSLFVISGAFCLRKKKKVHMLNQKAGLMSTIHKLLAVLCDTEKQHSNVPTKCWQGLGFIVYS